MFDINKRFIILATLIAIFITSLPAWAIPAFARKYKLSCSTCHVAVPKLKAFGEKFAANGFTLPKGREPKRAYVPTGDDLLVLHRQLPIAVRFDAYVRAVDRDSVKTDFGTPYGIKLLSGGPISKHVSYYFYFYISERGEVAGVEDAYLHFNDIGNIPFDIMLGQFQVSDPLFKRELRLSYEDYMVYKISPGLSKANLTYDRGIILTYSFDFGLDLFGMVINGNGIKPAENKMFDSDNDKNFALRFSQNLGMLRFGGFGYWGKEAINSIKNTISYYGGDATVSFKNFELNAQYLIREDDNPNFLAVAKKNTIKGGFAELIYAPQGDRSRFLFTILYNYIDDDMDINDYQTATFNISYLLARNLRVLAEYTHDLELKKPGFTLGFVTAF